MRQVRVEDTPFFRLQFVELFGNRNRAVVVAVAGGGVLGRVGLEGGQGVGVQEGMLPIPAVP